VVYGISQFISSYCTERLRLLADRWSVRVDADFKNQEEEIVKEIAARTNDVGILNLENVCGGSGGVSVRTMIARQIPRNSLRVGGRATINAQSLAEYIAGMYISKRYGVTASTDWPYGNNLKLSYKATE
jgi:hypothetical protein